MKLVAPYRRVLPLAGQCGLILFGLLGLYGFPPTSGRMILLPLTDGARSVLAPVAIANGARLVAKGPWAGSLLVEGRRNELAPALLRRGIVALSTQMSGCGASA
ncbi:hypothetical protein HHL08_01825 [Sphingobium sp. AR-3-1]|uniref:Uncharacterized protein n=1 Tax=Sphingobium psychrophilum TaxID=2728834 RepID=A0A7X9WS71_9SPHN|nr:hypothetical protein [Sphingobium psychrophilum]NML08892.1 hypothetical protein [Sphingobium psychrophilum]